MKKIIFAFCLLLSNQLVMAHFYDLTLSRIGTDTYLVENWSEGNEYWEIVTDYCYEDAYYDDATLYYNRDGHHNYLIFSNGYSCDFTEALEIKVYD